MTTRQVGIRLNTEGKAEVKRDFGEVATSGQQAGKAIEEGFDAAAVAAKRAEDAAARQMAKYKEMAKAAREYETQQQHQAKFNAILGVNGGGEKSARDSASVFEEAGNGKGGMTRQQRAGALNLLRQGADIFTQAGSGQGAGIIAIQQGPQILDALATSGFKASTSMIVLGGAVVATAGAVVALGAAQAAYEADTVKLTIATQGLGAASGMTTDQLEASAEAGARAGDVSVKAAREAAAAYVQTGRISGGVLEDLIALTRRYALTTGQDATAATKELGAAFADPAKGAAELNDKLHFLDASELKHIQNLADAGRGSEAQAILVDKLQGSLLSAADATTGWAHAMEGLGTAASNAFDAVGKAVDRAITGGSDAQRLTDLRIAKINEQQKIGGGSKHTIAQFDAEIDQLYRKYVAGMDRLRAAGVSDRSGEAQGIRDRYADPKIKALQDQQNTRSKYLLSGGQEGDATVKKIDAEISALKAGYSSAADQANKLAQGHRRAITEGRRQVRDEAKEAREAARAAELLARQLTLANDHHLDQERKLATIRGDDSALDLLNRQADLQQEINRYLAEGLSLEQARVKARAQISAEMQAESDRLRRERSNPEDFVSSADRLKGVGDDLIPFSAKDKFIEDLRITSGNALHDGLMAGMTGGNFFDVFTDRLKYAAASALADAITNAAVGKKDGSSSGWLNTAINAVVSYFGQNAAGTDNWRGGLTWVGEKGAELIDLPQGSKVYDHQSSIAMASANDRARTQAAAAIGQQSSGAVSVVATFAPVLTVSGGDSEAVGQLRAQLASMQANFSANVTSAVNDGLARRTIKAR